MKILYLSQRFNFKTAGIYADLMKALSEGNHDVTIVSCGSGDNVDYNNVYEENGCKMLYVKVGNQFGVNAIKKAIVQFFLPHSMLRFIMVNLKTRSSYLFPKTTVKPRSKKWPPNLN